MRWSPASGIGAVVLPCTEQLRAKDLALRIDVAAARALILADERNRAELEARAAGLPGPAASPTGRSTSADARAAPPSSSPTIRA